MDAMVNDPVWSSQMRARLRAAPSFSRSQILCRLYYMCAHLPYLFDYQGISICHLALPVAPGLKIFGMLLVHLALRHNYVCILRRLQVQTALWCPGYRNEGPFSWELRVTTSCSFFETIPLPPCSEEETWNGNWVLAHLWAFFFFLFFERE